MSWFTFNPVKYVQEEWNGESALGRYDPLHLFKELGATFGFWEHSEHKPDEKMPVVKLWESTGVGWLNWVLGGVVILILAVIGVMLLYYLLKELI